MITNFLNQKQQYIMRDIVAGKNIFLTGGAGSGKSTLIRAAIAQNSSRNIVYLAPTGIAALNIEGSTIHRFFDFPSSGVISHEAAMYAAIERCDLIQKVDTIIIDEISMVRLDIFQAIDAACRECADEVNASRPFGGKQIIVVGDFSQLPPVVNDPELQLYFDQVTNGTFAFNSQAWRDARFITYKLTSSLRCTDPRLQCITQAIRAGDADRSDINGNNVTNPCFDWDNTLLNVLNRSCVRSYKPDAESTCLCCRKRTAEAINAEALQHLVDPGIEVIGTVYDDFPVQALPTSLNLKIKRGERVMLLANQLGSDGRTYYANGSVGTVCDYWLDNDITWVDIQLKDGAIIKVKPYVWTSYDYSLEQDGRGGVHIRSRETGTFTQLPLAPAYAVTIHKSQGMTLEGSVYIALDQGGCFVPGQLYTALTRCRSLDQISLDRPITPADYCQDEFITEFYQDHGLA